MSKHWPVFETDLRLHFFPRYSFDAGLISCLSFMFVPIVEPVFDDFWQLPVD